MEQSRGLRVHLTGLRKNTEDLPTVGHLKFAPKNANLTRAGLLHDLYLFFNCQNAYTTTSIGDS